MPPSITRCGDSVTRPASSDGIGYPNGTRRWTGSLTAEPPSSQDPIQHRPPHVQCLIDGQHSLGLQSPNRLLATLDFNPNARAKHVEVIQRITQRDIDNLDPRLASQRLPQPNRQRLRLKERAT
jgi:hypothetical protein